MPIRTKEERRALHTTPQKKVRSDSDTKQGNASKVTRSGKKLYQETTIDGQKLYHELKTDTSAATETGQTGNIENLTIIGGATTGAAAVATSHNGLTHITPDQHHNHQHDIDSDTDHTGILSVSKGGTGLNTIAADRLLTGNGTAALTAEANLVYTSTGLGIGTTTPDSSLEISKDTDGRFIALKLTNESDAANTTGYVSIGFDLENTSGIAVPAGYINCVKEQSFTSTAGTNDSYISFETADNGTLSEKVWIKSDGKVGIGTPTPASLLDISGSSSDTDWTDNSGLAASVPSIMISNSANEDDTFCAIQMSPTEGGADQSFGIIAQATEHGSDSGTNRDDYSPKVHFVQRTDANEYEAAITIDENGYVGIGTTSPSKLLHIEKTATTGTVPLEILTLVVNDTGNVDLGIGEGPAIGFHVAEDGTFESNPSGQIAVVRESATDGNTAAAMSFWTAASDAAEAEKMRITSDGNVGIGTTSPDYELSIAASDGPTLSLGTSEGTINDGDMIGQILFGGKESSTFFTGAAINAVATDEWTTGSDQPTELLFYTQSNGAGNGTAAPRMVILDTGNVGIGVTDPDTTLEVLSGTTNQLKLSFDGTDNCTFGVDTSGHLTITPSGQKILLANDNSMGSASFASGFTGHGWIVSDGSSAPTGKQSENTSANATFDNLSVRGTMSVYELLIQQIRCTNGSLMISSVAKVESSSGLSASDDDGTITFEDPDNNQCPFLANDIIMCQRVNPGALVAGNAAGNATNVIKKMVYKVASVSNNVCTVENISYNNLETNGPVAGDDFVRIGNTGTASRQSVMYLTSDDTNAPFIDMKSDLDSYADWHAEASTKLRLGRLDGLTAGGTNEYGLWAGPSTTNYIKASNVGVFIKGSEATYLKATANTIEFFDTNKKMEVTGGSIKMYADNGSTVMTEWNDATLTFGGATGNDTDGITISDGGVTCWGSANTNYVNIDSAQVTIQSSAADKCVIDADGMTLTENSQVRAIFGAITAIGSAGAAVAVDSTDDCIRISDGAVNIFQDSNNRALIDSSGLGIWQGGNQVAQFGSTVYLGQTAHARTAIDNTSIKMYSGQIDGTSRARVEIDNTGKIAIGGAADADVTVGTAVDCIRLGDGELLMMHSATEYSRLDENGLSIFDGDASNSVATFAADSVITGGTITLRNTTNANDKFVLTENSAKLYDNNTQIANFGAETIIGEVGAGKSNIQITSGAINLRTNNVSKLTLDTSGNITTKGIIQIETAATDGDLGLLLENDGTGYNQLVFKGANPEIHMGYTGSGAALDSDMAGSSKIFMCAKEDTGGGAMASITFEEENTAGNATTSKFSMGYDENCGTFRINTGDDIRTDANTIMELDASGFIVIGDATNSPAAKLRIVQSVDGNNSQADDASVGNAIAIENTEGDDWLIGTDGEAGSSELVFSNPYGEGGGYLVGQDWENILTFTGQHFTIPSSGTSDDYESSIGYIVVSDGEYDNLSNPANPSGSIENKPNINESLPKVSLSNTSYNKKVFGVISNTEDSNNSRRNFKWGAWGSFSSKRDDDDNRLIVNSLGEGAIWISNYNGNLENGDYITSSVIEGIGMKQDDDLLHNYTVAKITQDCNFDMSSELYDCIEISYSGQTYKKAFVGCTYHCG